MLEQDLTIPAVHLRRLLTTASPDAALLYLYLSAGGDPSGAVQALRFTARQSDYAAMTLRQLGLYPEKPAAPVAAPPPPITEQQLAQEYENDPAFSALVGEAQRRFGRLLSTEELKTLLSIYHHAGLPAEVISILLYFCTERARARDPMRLPTLRAIEREGYRWAELGIDTLEEAAVYIQSQLRLQLRVTHLREALQIEDRKLTAGEEKLLQTWVCWGFEEDVVRAAYEKTCMNTGSLKWPYLHSILKSWHEQGFTTLEQIRAGDQGAQPAAKKSRPKQAVIQHGDEMGEFERRAAEKMMQKGLYPEKESE